MESDTIQTAQYKIVDSDLVYRLWEVKIIRLNRQECVIHKTKNDSENLQTVRQKPRRMEKHPIGIIFVITLLPKISPLHSE